VVKLSDGGIVSSSNHVVVQRIAGGASLLVEESNTLKEINRLLSDEPGLLFSGHIGNRDPKIFELLPTQIVGELMEFVDPSEKKDTNHFVILILSKASHDSPEKLSFLSSLYLECHG
jgi:hypothetical protein